MLKRLLICAVLLLGACAPKTTTPTSTPEATPASDGAIELRAGVNDPKDLNVAVLEFLPESISVKTGTKVRWTLAGPEPHSVTFFPAGQSPPAPSEASKYFAPTPPSAPIDGTALVNSGLAPTGKGPVKFEATFAKAGKYGYVCVIHPLMTGSVTVVDASGKADTQQDVTTRGDTELESWLADGRAAKQKLTSAAPRKSESGGKTTWWVEMGATTQHTDVLAFAPTPASAKVGDSVVFINNSGAPHTATFGNGKPVPTDPESAEAQKPAPGPGPQTLDTSKVFNTGWLPPNAPPGGGPPEAARSYTYVLGTAGSFDYVCILHVPSGMVGKITVA